MWRLREQKFQDGWSGYCGWHGWSFWVAWVVSSIYGFSFLPAWCIQKAQTMRLVVVVVAAGAKEPIADGRGCGRGFGEWEWNWKTVGWQENWEAGNAQRKNQMTNDILLRHPEGHAHVEEWAWTWSLGLCATHPPEHPPIALLGQKLILYANSKLKNS